MRRIAWLLPGLGIKRWMLFLAMGALAMVVGLLGVSHRWWAPWLGSGSGAEHQPALMVVGMSLLLAGMAVCFWGAKRGKRALETAWREKEKPDLILHLRQRRRADRGPRLVVIGGGTGLATLLRGLKQYTNHLTAIVTVTDDGGSSGRLRRDLGIPPPGDIRNCLLALADTEPVMERLFQHRFQQGSELAGHNFGNLFIAAMTEMSGDFEQAVHLFSQVLAVRGRVLPATLTDVRLRAYFADGTSVIGEMHITTSGKPIRRVELEPREPPALPAALAAITQADAVIIGPGSLYTSIVPNLLVSGVVEALRQTEAKVIYVCNVMTQPGETRGYTAVDHLEAVLAATGPGVLDLMLMNGEAAAHQRLTEYTEKGATPVAAEKEGVQRRGVEPVVVPLLNVSGLIRHDPEKLARAVLASCVEERNGQWWDKLHERWEHFGSPWAGSRTVPH